MMLFREKTQGCTHVKFDSQGQDLFVNIELWVMMWVV